MSSSPESVEIDSHENTIVEVESDEPTEIVEISTGAPGPPGPPAAQYIHSQGAAAATWMITHNLGRFPAAVRIEDSAHADVEGAIDYIDLNTLRIDFNAAFTGTAYIN
jgi:hypothetical protein